MEDRSARLILFVPAGRPHPGAAAVLWVVFVLAAVVSSVLILQRAPDDRLSDLHIYYGAAEAVRAGDALYGYVAENGGPFTYPPLAAVLFVMVTWLPELTLRIVWLTVACAAVAVLGVLTARLVPRRGHLVAPGIALTVLVSASAQSNLRFGQVSLFLVLLALADAAGLTPARHRGVLIGVAAAIKLTPLLFVLFLLSSGQTRPAVRAGAVFLGCGALGALALPSASWTYWSGTFLHTSRIGDLTATGNQSINGVLLRAGVPGEVLVPLWFVLATAVGLAALWQARRAQLAGEPARAAVVIGCGTVAASPVSWTHHQVWLVLAGVILVLSDGGRAQRLAGTVLLVIAILPVGEVLRTAGAYPGPLFLGDNARALGAIAVCLAGLGMARVAAGAPPATGPLPCPGPGVHPAVSLRAWRIFTGPRRGAPDPRRTGAGVGPVTTGSSSGRAARTARPGRR